MLKKSEIKSIGIQNDPKENFTGLIGMLQRKEHTIIPKLEAYIERYSAVDFSTTLWITQ